MKKVTLTIAFLLSVLCSGLQVSAQDYEDDLYYSPKKEAEKQKKLQEKKQAEQEAEFQARDNYSGSDSYAVGTTMPRTVDVDAYNRRTGSSDATTSSSSSPEFKPDYSYTRRIEKYHNPDIVSESGDTVLMETYYASPSDQDINVYVINNIPSASYRLDFTPWGLYNSWTFGSPYYSWYWPYSSPYFSMSWGWGGYWGPSWGWSWCYSPWYDWAWGGYWGPSWGWGPAWGWSRPPYHYPDARPPYGSNSPGASRPHRPSYSHASAGGYRQGAWDYERPGNMGRPGGDNQRPGNNGGSHASPSVSRPGNSGNHSSGTYTPSNNSRRGSSSGSNHNSSSSSNYRGSSSNRHSSPSGSYRSGSNNSSRGSGFGGGSHRGGSGGAGRGRR